MDVLAGGEALTGRGGMSRSSMRSMLRTAGSADRTGDAPLSARPCRGERGGRIVCAVSVGVCGERADSLAYALPLWAGMARREGRNDMKTVYLVGGTMGVGKTTVCRQLEKKLDRSVFLDGDWCWDAHPFQVTEETKTMVLQNIRFLLNQFIRCTAYEHIIFCWVMHEQTVIDAVLSGLNTADCAVKCVSLLCREETLRERLAGDVAAGLRSPDVTARSVQRLPLYEKLNTVKIATDGKGPSEVADEIAAL